MNSDERLTMDETFQKIAETRRPNSLDWLEGHRVRMERMRLEPEFAAYQSELMRAKLEDVTATLHAIIARLNPNGQRGFGHIGQPPPSRAQGKS